MATNSKRAKEPTSITSTGTRPFVVQRGEVLPLLGRTVLTDHHERREKDRLQRHDQRECRPRLLLQQDHPHGEQRHVQVHKVHRTREGGDAVGDAILDVLGSLFRVLNECGVPVEPESAMHAHVPSFPPVPLCTLRWLHLPSSQATEMAPGGSDRPAGTHGPSTNMIGMATKIRKAEASRMSERSG